MPAVSFAFVCVFFFGMVLNYLEAKYMFSNKNMLINGDESLGVTK